MFIEETLHKSDSLYFFIGGNSGIGTWNYTKAILIYMDFILGRTLTTVNNESGLIRGKRDHIAYLQHDCLFKNISFLFC